MFKNAVMTSKLTYCIIIETSNGNAPSQIIALYSENYKKYTNANYMQLKDFSSTLK
jgi:hypothetical protein